MNVMLLQIEIRHGLDPHTLGKEFFDKNFSISKTISSTQSSNADMDSGGFEPPTSRLQTECSSNWAKSPMQRMGVVKKIVDVGLKQNRVNYSKRFREKRLYAH